MTDGPLAESAAAKLGQANTPVRLRVGSQEFVEFLRDHFLECILAEETLVAIGSVIGQQLAYAGQVIGIRPGHRRCVD